MLAAIEQQFIRGAAEPPDNENRVHRLFRRPAPGITNGLRPQIDGDQTAKQITDDGIEDAVVRELASL